MKVEHTSMTRALSRLAMEGAVLARARDGRSYGVFPNGDRRRRPLARLIAREVQALESEGALTPIEGKDVLVLSEAGRARARRGEAIPVEAFRAQHDEIVARAVMDEAGDARAARGVDASGALARLARMTDSAGSPFFSSAEIAAGKRLRADWEQGQEGLLRGSDWSAPPRGSAVRGAGGGLEAARASAVDARRRCEEALNALGPQAAQAVRLACLEEIGFDAMERAAGWPQRSGKVAVKFALAQLVMHYRLR